MISINVIGDQLSGSYGDKVFSVRYSKELYEKMVAVSDTLDGAETMEDYNKLLEEFEKLTVEDYSEVIAHKCPNIVVNPHTNEYFLKSDSGVVSSIPMPETLVRRIEDSMDKGIEFMPLIKLWTRWLRNPVLADKMANGTGRQFTRRFFNFISLEYVHPQLKEKYEEEGLNYIEAAKKATMYQMKITKEGLLNGYKVSKEILHKFDPESGEKVDRYKRTFNVDTGKIESDGIPSIVEDRLFEPAVQGQSGDAFYCEGANGYEKPGHFIKVGCVHRLESWSQVNTNDRESCVKGLHFGGLNYINCISGEIHNVFVDPMHIGAVPDDTTGAIRCLQYFVHSSLAGVNGSIYHSSTYAAKTDAEWEKLRLEAIKMSEEAVMCETKGIEELKAL